MRQYKTDHINIEELKELRFEIREGKIAIITINRPDVRNSMTAESWTEFFACLDWVEDHPEIRVLIITGAGEKSFIAGADIVTLKTRSPMYQFHNPYSTDATIRLEQMNIPVIAAVNGFAFGAGCETALACDIRIAARSAKFGLPELNLGILPGAGGTQRLARIAGLGIAKEVILAGRVLSAEEAKQCGLVMKVVEQEELLDAAIEVANTMIKKAPIALSISKKLINLSLDSDRYSGMTAEQLGMLVLLGTEDKVEGTSAFLEKRIANFRGE